MKFTFAAALIAATSLADSLEVAMDSAEAQHEDDNGFQFFVDDGAGQQIVNLPYDVIPGVTIDHIPQQTVIDFASRMEEKEKDIDDRSIANWEKYMDAIRKPWYEFLVEQNEIKNDDIANDTRSMEEVLRWASSSIAVGEGENQKKLGDIVDIEGFIADMWDESKQDMEQSDLTQF